MLSAGSALVEGARSGAIGPDRRRPGVFPAPPPSGRPCAAAGGRRRCRAGSAARRRSADTRARPRTPRSRQAEQDEGADHARVHRPHSAGDERDQVRDHPDEEPLDHDAERAPGRRRRESSPEDADVRGPEADRADDREPARARDCGRSRSRSGCRSPGSPGTVARRRRPQRPSPAAERRIRRSRSLGSRAITRKISDHGAGDRGRDDRQPRRVRPVQHPGSQQHPVDDQVSM